MEGKIDSYHLLISVVEILLPWPISSYPRDGTEDEVGKRYPKWALRTGRSALRHMCSNARLRQTPSLSVSFPHRNTSPWIFAISLSLSSPNLLFSFSLLPKLEGSQTIVFNSSFSSSTKSSPAMTTLAPYKFIEVFFFVSYCCITWNKWIYFHQIWRVYVVWPEWKWATAYFNIYESILVYINTQINGVNKKALLNSRKPINTYTRNDRTRKSSFSNHNRSKWIKQENVSGFWNHWVEGDLQSQSISPQSINYKRGGVASQ